MPGPERGGATATPLLVGVTPRRVVTVLAIGAALVVAAGILAVISRVGLGHGRLYGLVPLVDLDAEANIPATYNGVLLALSAIPLWLIATHRRRNRLPHVMPLRVLSLLVLAMALDEMAQAHEILSEPVRVSLDLSGALYYAWVFVYGLVFVILLATMLPRARYVPARTRRLVLLATAIYIAGALGLELAGSAVADAGRRGEWIYGVFTTMEESMELTGCLILLFALLSALGASARAVIVEIEPPVATRADQDAPALARASSYEWPDSETFMR